MFCFCSSENRDRFARPFERTSEASVNTARQMRGDGSSEARRCLTSGSALRPRSERARATDDARAMGWVRTRFSRDTFFSRHFLRRRRRRVFSLFGRVFHYSNLIIPFLRFPPPGAKPHHVDRDARKPMSPQDSSLAFELDSPAHDDPDDHPEQTERASEDLDDEDLHEQRRVLRVRQRARRSDGADADSAD